jgi:hypothetical protein
MYARVVCGIALVLFPAAAEPAERKSDSRYQIMDASLTAMIHVFVFGQRTFGFPCVPTEARVNGAVSS